MSETITASNIFFDCPASTVDDVLGFFSKKAVELGYASDANAVFEAFRAREEEGTTGMAGGFAIPHAKTSAVSEAVIMVAKFSGEVEWASMDNVPVKCAIALLIPADEAGTTHLRLLSKIAKMLINSHKRERLLAADTADKIIAEVEDALAYE